MTVVVVIKKGDRLRAAQQTNVGFGPRLAGPSRPGHRDAKAPTSTGATYPSSSTTATHREAHTVLVPVARPPAQATPASNPKTPAMALWDGSTYQTPATSAARTANLSAIVTYADSAYRPSVKVAPYEDRFVDIATTAEPITGSI